MKSRSSVAWIVAFSIMMTFLVLCMLPVNYAKAKSLPTIPSELQGYWYAYEMSGNSKGKKDRVYLHITANRIENSVVGDGTIRGTLNLLLNLHLDGEEIITKEQKTNRMKGDIGENRTETFNQVRHNHWNTYAIFAHKLDKTGYLTTRYALTGKKGHYKLFVQAGLYTEKGRIFNKKPLSAHEKKLGKHPVLKYTKISNKYLKSIGIYR